MTIKDGHAVRRWLQMRPMPRGAPETAHPVNVEAALRAVEREVLELAFESAFTVSNFRRSILAW
jgi:hypothetical protein